MCRSTNARRRVGRRILAACETDSPVVIGRHGRRRLVINAFPCPVDRRRGWRPSGRHRGKSTPTVTLNGHGYSARRRVAGGAPIRESPVSHRSRAGRPIRQGSPPQRRSPGNSRQHWKVKTQENVRSFDPAATITGVALQRDRTKRQSQGFNRTEHLYMSLRSE